MMMVIGEDILKNGNFRRSPSLFVNKSLGYTELPENEMTRTFIYS
jgi:hypothetical protein